MNNLENVKNKPGTKADNTGVYYIQKEGEYTLSFYLNKMVYSPASTGEPEEIPYESIKEISIRKKISLYTLIKYLGILFVGIALGALTVAGITGSYSNSYVLPCLSSSVILFIIGIFMAYLPKEASSLEISGDRHFLIEFPEKDRPIIEDIVYLIRFRTLKNLLETHESKGIILEKSKWQRPRLKQVSKSTGNKMLSIPLEPNEKIKFDIEGLRGSRILFTDKRIVYVKPEKLHAWNYEEISDIKKEYEATTENVLGALVGFLIILAILIFYIEMIINTALDPNAQVSWAGAGVCTSIFLILLFIPAVYLHQVLRRSKFFIKNLNNKKVMISSTKENDAKINEAIKYAKIIIEKKFMEKVNDKDLEV